MDFILTDRLSADLHQKVEEWTDYLKYEKHVSKHTFRAYSNDLKVFLMI